MKAPIAALVATVVSLPIGYFLGRQTDSADSSARSAGQPRIPPLVTAPVNPRAPGAAQDASLAGLTDAQVRERVTAALREPDRILHSMAWAEVLAGTDANNIAIVSEALLERYRSGANTGEDGVLLQFREGQLFGATAMQLPREPNGKMDLPARNKMAGWASIDPKAARAWLDALEPGSVQDTLRASWLDGLGRSAPEKIAEMFPNLKPGEQRPLLNGLLTGLHDSGGVPAMQKWLEQNRSGLDPSVLEGAFTGITSRMSQNPEKWNETADFLRAHASDPEMSRASFEAFSFRVALGNPGKCLDLLQDLTAASPSLAEQLDKLIASTVDRSSSLSLNNMGQWLNSHRSHPLYDKTAQQFALRTNIDDPESARHWAETIQDVALREATRTELAARAK